MERRRFPLSLNPDDAVKKDEPGRRTMPLKIPGILSADIATRLLTVIKDFTELPTASVFLNDPATLATGDFLGQFKRRQTKHARPPTGTAILQ
jgi:hypothetical protein